MRSCWIAVLSNINYFPFLTICAWWYATAWFDMNTLRESTTADEKNAKRE
jgi:hypothetical protein